MMCRVCQSWEVDHVDYPECDTLPDYTYHRHYYRCGRPP